MLGKIKSSLSRQIYIKILITEVNVMYQIFTVVGVDDQKIADCLGNFLIIIVQSTLPWDTQRLAWRRVKEGLTDWHVSSALSLISQRSRLYWSRHCTGSTECSLMFVIAQLCYHICKVQLTVKPDINLQTCTHTLHPSHWGLVSTHSSQCNFWWSFKYVPSP